MIPFSQMSRCRPFWSSGHAQPGQSKPLSAWFIRRTARGPSTGSRERQSTLRDAARRAPGGGRVVVVAAARLLAVGRAATLRLDAGRLAEHRVARAADGASGRRAHPDGRRPRREPPCADHTTVGGGRVASSARRSRLASSSCSGRSRSRRARPPLPRRARTRSGPRSITSRGWFATAWQWNSAVAGVRPALPVGTLRPRAGCTRRPGPDACSSSSAVRHAPRPGTRSTPTRRGRSSSPRRGGVDDRGARPGDPRGEASREFARERADASAGVALAWRA